MKILDLNELGDDNQIAFDNIFYKNQKRFSYFILKIFNQTSKKIYWNVSSIFSKNLNLSHIYKDFCYISLIKGLLKKKKIKKIITQSLRQKYLFSYYFKNIKISSNDFTIKTIIKFFFSNLLDWLSNFWYCIILFYLSLTQKKKLIPNKIILFRTFLLKSMIDQNYNFQDRYFNEIDKYTKKKNTFFLLQLPSSKDLLFFNKMINRKKNNKRNWIAPYEFLKFKDLCIALFINFRLNKKVFDQIYFNKINMRPLIINDLNNFRFNRNSFLGILNFLILKNLKKEDIEIKKTISWYENQPIDKGFYYGLSKYYKKIDSIGYQGYIIPYKRVPHYKPDRLEIDNGLAPKILGVQGKGLKKFYKFKSHICTKVYPAFRFQHLYKSKKQANMNTKKIKNIFVALTIFKEESLKILEIINKLIIGDFLKKFNIYYSIHPALKIKTNNFPYNFKQKTKLFNKEIKYFDKKIDLLVTGNSTIGVECLTQGIPVATYGKNKDYDIIVNNLGSKYCNFFSNDLMLKKILKNISNNKIKIKKKNYLKNNFFCKLNKSNLGDFLN